MLIKTNSNRIYSYSPSTNRILPNAHEGEEIDYVHFGISDEFNFSRIGMYTIEITQECNLRCKYCCYSGAYANRRKHNGSTISYQNLERCVEFIKAHTPDDVPVVYVSFYGGEALLCRDKIKWLMSELSSRCGDRNFEFSISTNGLLLDEDTVDWICHTPNLYLSITIDGDRVMHDKNRVTSNEHGSYDIIIDNLRLFKRKYPDLFVNRIRFLSTLKSITDLIPLNDFWMSSDLLRENRPQHISTIIPNFEKGEHPSVDKRKFENVYEVALSHLKSGKDDILTDELRNLTKVIKRRSYRPLESVTTLQTCINVPESCFVSSDGKLYVCERFCTQYSIGNLETGIDKELSREICMAYIARKNHICSNCWARRICRKCPIGLNFTESQYKEYCECEKMQLQLALKYFCEVLEYERGIN